MPRYYRRRYTRVVRPKKKWATNMREIDIDVSDQDTNALGFYKAICVNQTEVEGGSAVAPTPTIVKTGNYKVQCDVILNTSASALVYMYAYILYVPEGVFTPNGTVGRDYTALNNLVLRHPEWILAWKQVGADFLGANANVDRVVFSSRLKRNLNSGDQVYFVLTAKASTGNITKFGCKGMAQFWTCAN